MMRIRKFAKRIVRQAVAELYWAIDAKEEDNYAKNFIIFQEVPKNADMDLIVVEIDKKAEEMGGVATRILRDIRGQGPNGKK